VTVEGLVLENDASVSYEATVRSNISVGDGHWSVSLPTGSLERGDGRLLADHDGTMLLTLDPGKPRGGVQPDRDFPLPRRGLGRALMPPVLAARLREETDQPAGASSQPAAKPAPAADPILDAAVKVLREARGKS
jgi:hypothetical protein